MFSNKSISASSRLVAIITDDEKKPFEQIYFTEKTRELKGVVVPDFKTVISKYISREKDGFYELKPEYSYEPIPSEVSPKFPRFVNYYLASSNSGKSYQIAQYCKRYLQLFPDNQIIYASANPLDNDVNYESIKDKIKEIDVLKMENQVNFTEFKDCLFIFDDCDAGFSSSMTDLDDSMTEENMKQLTVTDKQKAKRMLDKNAEMCIKYINDSVKSLLYCGRKNRISLCVVGHKANDGRFQMKIIDEASSIILFPSSMRKGVVQTFIERKLDFSRDEAQELMELPWYQYDFLVISHKGTPFIITNDRLKIYN